ncbi:DUF2975 domain-containing protein [Serratia fonticola]|uniref:DUF2975 domain-containing protein n=1 Tax=Serratia fonticola TaxID=47917 RepID=UPI002DB81245|nr:DUF2975 domain-containing protein [Serratia fonticola]MEB7885405.1 DUF2975 domain-containing protein [Serratia fonticola]
MTLDRLTRFSQRMATITLCLLLAMLLFNATYWLFPSLAANDGYGFHVSISNELISALGVDLYLFPWWQIAGGIIFSSVPLLALALGLYHLRKLFQTYAQRAYFSGTAAHHLGKMGQYVAIWTILELLCQPVLSYWITMHEPVGQRMVTLGIDTGNIVALFLAACIAVIAQILKQASKLHYENQQFV